MEIILALEYSIDDRGGDRDLRVARQVENRFHFVGHVPIASSPRNPAMPFDGVEAAENRVHRLGIGGILIERQQLQLDRGQVLARLEYEIVQQLRIGRQWIV